MHGRTRLSLTTFSCAVLLLASTGAAGQDVSSDEVSIFLEAWFTTASEGQPTKLFVKAEMGEGWYVSSLKQKPPCIPAQIRLDPSKQYRLLEGFTPASAPKIVRDAEGILEKHTNEIIWSAPIRLAPGVDPATLAISGELVGRICSQGTCRLLAQLDNELTARFRKTTAAPGDGAAVREKKVASPGDPKQSGRPEARCKDGGRTGDGAEKASRCVTAQGEPLKLTYEQITFGDKHHFFGYIGQSLTIPWNAGQRYIVALETDFHDHMPGPDDAARVIIIDTENDYRIEYLDETRGWNIQQGTMLYWNPEAPETQFIFNDRDSDGKVFAVLYDIQKRKRIREFKFEDTPIGNGGVAPGGGYFLGINYARLARLRPVTGYPKTYDWTVGELAPKDDGIFLVNINTGKKELLVSFSQLAEYLGNDQAAFYINHTLWNRESERIYFFARGRIGDAAMKINEPFSMLRDGSQLTNHDYIGGHPEWGVGDTIIGAKGNRQVLYHVVQRKVVGEIGNSDIWNRAGGDISLSPNAKMFVNGSAGNKYIVYRMSDGEYVESKKFSRGEFSSGDLRIDPAPRWNRKSNAILVSQWVDDARQLFIIHVAS